MSIRERLSQLTFPKACKLLGADGEKLIRQGGALAQEIDISNDVIISGNQFIVDTLNYRVLIELIPPKNKTLRIISSTGKVNCLEVGAVLSLILEEKLMLGLAEAPDLDSVPLELLDSNALVERALEERLEKAEKENIKITSLAPETLWTDYSVTNRNSGKSYKVALRGLGRGVSYCACPDFKTNTLGTCKHILAVEIYVRKKFPVRELQKPYIRQRSSVSLSYNEQPQLVFNEGENLSETAKALLKPYMAKKVDNVSKFARVLEELEGLEEDLLIYPDAEEFINKELQQNRLRTICAEIRSNPEIHPLRNSLLNAELRPYQLDGIAFAVNAGRCILADDMGLGKTIQGIGIAELFAREAEIKRVLVICPASLKGQWREEVRRFSGRSVQLVVGNAEERLEQYDSDKFMTVCNYEQIIRDHNIVSRIHWDLIILDEAQRIKNWQSRTSQLINSLKSQFALVLSGTPLENRLEELYTITRFVDQHRLGPAFRFMHKHRVTDDSGKVLKYQNLDELRKSLKPILLRRTRDMVLKELPEKQTEVITVPATEEQRAIDGEQRRTIKMILGKKYISEMDLLRLQKALLMARMAADSTYLVDKQKPHESGKMEKLQELVSELIEQERKIIIFSEWTTMLDLIQEEALQGVEYVRLDGSVPQRERQQIVEKFQTESSCRVILMSNAGTTGLNLQEADTVINVDLPWNPAVLEQRIARAHRMGQKNKVQVYILVSEGMLEQQILVTLASKKELFNQTLSPDASEDIVDFECGMDELRRRLEVLIGSPENDVDESMKESVDTEILEVKKKKSVADAGGKMLGAAFEFLAEAMALEDESTPEQEALFQAFTKGASKNEDDSYSLSINIDEGSLKKLTGVLAGIMKRSGE